MGTTASDLSIDGVAAADAIEPESRAVAITTTADAADQPVTRHLKSPFHVRKISRPQPAEERGGGRILDRRSLGFGWRAPRVTGHRQEHDGQRREFDVEVRRLRPREGRRPGVLVLLALACAAVLLPACGGSAEAPATSLLAAPRVHLYASTTGSAVVLHWSSLPLAGRTGYYIIKD